MGKSERDQNSPEARCSRREFLWRVGSTGAVAAAAGGLGYALHNRVTDKDQATVVLPDFRVEEVSGRPRIVAARGGSPLQMLQLCLEEIGGLGHFIKPGDRVVLKPNVGFASPPELGATTSPDVVGAMARLCLAEGAAEVLVIDNPIHDPARCLAISGIASAAEANGARVVQPRPGLFRDVEAPGNAVLKKWSFFYRPFEGATKVIGLPTAKHHSLSGVTLEMKNWYGLLGGRRNRLHQDIHMSVADLASMVRPTLTVLDATRVLFRHGPTGGSPSDVRHDGILAVATDPVALDAYGADVVGADPASLGFLVEAERRGLGTSNLMDAGFRMIRL
jgi:uncharacterized protein (DUF362 family)